MNNRSGLVWLSALSLAITLGFMMGSSRAIASPLSVVIFGSGTSPSDCESVEYFSYAYTRSPAIPQAGAVPIAVDDSDSTNEDTAKDTNVVSNDSLGENPHVLKVVNTPANGTAVPKNNKSITYTPNPNYFGMDSYDYELCDRDNDCSTATVTITINPVNDPPNAVDDSASTPENTQVTIPVLENDSDVENDTLLLQSFDTTSEKGGTVVRFDNGTGGDLSDDQVTYAPALNFSGTDVFTYTVSDGAASANAQVTITVIGQQNDPPNAINDNYTTPKNTPLNVTAASGVLFNDNDPDGDALTAILDTGPSNGTLNLNADGSFTYTPNAEFVGQDTFTYHANDGLLDSGTATVTINVQDGNLPPVASDDSYTIPINNALTVSAPGVLVNDYDPDGDSLTALLDTGPTNGTVTLNSDGSFSYTPTTNFFGTDTFIYRASDGVFTSNPATVTIQVLEGNIAPAAGNDAYFVLQDQTLSVDAPGVLQNDSDLNGDSLTTILDDAPDHDDGTFVLNADGSFTYTPMSGFIGQDFFRYRASDGVAESNSAVVTIEVGEADTQNPDVVWMSPISNGEFLKVGEEVVHLEVAATDNSGIASVRFYRWDAVNLVRVEIGMVYSPPYSWDLDTRELNWGDNQINVKAYDLSGNDTTKHIWLTKLRRVYLPVTTR